MITVKFGSENFFSAVFTEDAVANAIRNLPTGKAKCFKWYSSFYCERD